MKWLAVTRPASMDSALSQPPSSACSPNSPKATKLPRIALPRTLPRWFFRNFTLLGICGIVVPLVVQEVAVVDPDLDADIPLGGVGFRESVVDLGPQSRERNAPLHRAFTAGHFRPAEPAGELNANAQRARLHGLVDRPLHGAAEALTFLQLVGHLFRNKLGVHFGPGHLHRLDLDMAMGKRLQFLRQFVDFLSLLADD